MRVGSKVDVGPGWRAQHALAAHMSRAERRSPAARAPAPRRALTPNTRHPLQQQEMTPY